MRMRERINNRTHATPVFRLMVAAIFGGALIGAGGPRANGMSDGIVVIADGASNHVIALAADADPDLIGQAARYLQRALDQAAGVTLPILPETEVPEGRPAIYLGASNAARRAGLPVDEIKGWSYLVRAVGSDIFLVGEDASAGVEGANLAYLGSFGAVTSFLESEAGVRFVLPGPFGTHVPETDRLIVDAGLDRRWTPWLKYIIGRHIRGTDPDSRAYALSKGFGIRPYSGRSPVLASYGGHSYYTAVPAKEYWESNPEYFALINGVRTADGNHLCISNPEVQQLMIEEMERQLDRGFQWVELAQTDGYRPCECSECAAIHEDRGERIWIVHRQLAEEMRRRRPDGKVMILVYRDTRMPPKTFDTFPDNVVLQTTRYRPEHFEPWARFNVPMTVYTTLWLSPYPRVSPDVAVRLARMFRENDVRGIYLCGGLDWWTPWGLAGPGYYAFGRALRDPGVSSDALSREYVAAAFGEAAAPMQAFFNALHHRTDAFWLLFRRDASLGNVPVMRTTGDFECHFFEPGMLRDMQRNLERAREISTDERVRARIELVSHEFAYLRAVATVHHLYRTYRLVPSWEAMGLLEQGVQEFQAVLERLYPDGKPLDVDGLRPVFSGAPRARLAEPGRRAPFNWDFDLLREHQVLPGVSLARLDAMRIDPFDIDGRVDSERWKGMRAESLREIGMGATPHATTFRVAYDNAHLYLAFEAEIPTPTALDYVQPDGLVAAWRQENMEVVIDTFGDRQRYKHFIVNPAPNAAIARRRGYIDDPDEPLYDGFEPVTGAWEYRTHIDREARRWTAELKIPFDLLGTDPPGPGEVWTINVGRTEFAEDETRERGGSRARLSLWSPNLESRSFHDTSTFGELTFR